MKKFLKYLFFSMMYLLLLFIAILGAYTFAYIDRVSPGVHVEGINVSNWTKEEVANFFKMKSGRFNNTKLVLVWNGNKWETSGKALGLGYDFEKTAELAFGQGRSGNFIKDTIFKWQIFWKEIFLKPEYNFNEVTLNSYLANVAQKINVPPVEGLFEFQDGKVIAFRPSFDGRALEIEKTIRELKNRIPKATSEVVINLPVAVLKPKAPMEKADSLGIKELIGSGESFFKDSIPERMHNIKLGSLKLHGILIPPGETFSFNQNIGKVSTFSGYKRAYVIEKGKTVLGDGGGVCQISTTLFRAALYSGLPIVERVAHSYRVGYYEPPIGMDATVYDPSPDFKFKNDTGKYILIQTRYEEDIQRLSFELYGTKDGRETILSAPVIVSQQPAPTPTYQDDPNLAKGVEKQIDTAHTGAKVYFTRTVVRNGQDLINETIWSNYIPWAAVILRGTKE